MLAFSYVIDDEMMQLFTRSHFETPSSESMNRELCGKCKVIVYKFCGELFQGWLSSVRFKYKPGYR